MTSKTMKDKNMRLVATIAVGFLVTPLAAQEKKPAAEISSGRLEAAAESS